MESAMPLCLRSHGTCLLMSNTTAGWLIEWQPPWTEWCIMLNMTEPGGSNGWTSAVELETHWRRSHFCG